MWWTVSPLSRGSVPLVCEMYEMSQVCHIYYSWNWWYIIEHSFCNATSLEYPSDTWCWLGSSFDIPSSFVHINWTLRSFKNIFWNFVRHNGWCSSLSILLQWQTLWQYKFCEVAKVDLSIQHWSQTKEQNYERYVSNSLTLVKVLFEKLRPAIDCIQDLGHQTMKAKLDQHFTLFSSEKNGTMKDTLLICGMELTLNYPPNKMNHSKFLNHVAFSFIG